MNLPAIAVSNPTPKLGLVGPMLAGAVVIVVFFGLFLGWAFVTPLATAAISPGTVMIDTNRKIIQHLEGGIVTRVLVGEGQQVEAGEALVELDTTQAQARLNLLRAQFNSVDAQLLLLESEIADIEELVAQGLATRHRLLDLQRRHAELDGEKSRLVAEMMAAEDVLHRSVIRSAWNGMVIGLQVHSPGGVVTPGEPLMSIVPEGGGVVIEARVDPLDVDAVRAGQEAIVHLTSFSQRSTAPFTGTVLSISADTLADQRTGQTYYLARIKVEDTASAPGGEELTPGMPAEVMILTGQRTLFEAFLDPLLRSMRRSFRES